MSKWIKNNTAGTKTYAGKDITAGAYREVDSDLWSKDSLLLTDIGNGDAIVAKDDTGTTDISDISEAIDFLKSNVPSQVEVTKQDQIPPFASKTIPETGQKLFRRKHGFSVDGGGSIAASSSGTMSFVIPYALAKMTEVEIIGAKTGDTVDLKVYDTPAGTISTVPNYMLNQFGFEVALAKDYYSDTSNYDADVIMGMKVELTYYNNSSEAATPVANIVLHEVISA